MKKHPVYIMGTQLVLLDNLESMHSLQKTAIGAQINEEVAVLTHKNENGETSITQNFGLSAPR